MVTQIEIVSAKELVELEDKVNDACRRLAKTARVTGVQVVSLSFAEFVIGVVTYERTTDEK